MDMRICLFLPKHPSERRLPHHLALLFCILAPTNQPTPVTERYSVSLDSTRLTHPSEGAEGGGLTLPVPAAAGARAVCVRLTCAVPAAPPAEHRARKTASLQPTPGPRGWIGIPQGEINTDHLPLHTASFFKLNSRSIFKQNSQFLIQETEFCETRCSRRPRLSRRSPPPPPHPS